MSTPESFAETAAILRPNLGTVVELPVARFGPPGAFLLADPADTRAHAPTVLLPGKEVPPGTREGDPIEVFLTLDSDDRPLATTQFPKLERGEVAFLRVTSIAPFGAFVDWGLPKELLVPLKEQTRDLVAGEVHPFGLYVDDTGRLAGTMRVSEMLRDVGDFEVDEWVQGESWRLDPAIGVFVILERAFVGLLPATEPHTLSRGDAARFRIARIHRDGKLELSLRAKVHEQMGDDAERVLTILSSPHTPRMGDRSSPEEIARVFNLSKKAFKRAVGRLLRERKVEIDNDGFLTLISR